MYGVRVSRSFAAHHYLTVPDAGPEGELHAHDYTVDVGVRGRDLNEHGYLVDIDVLARAVERVVGEYEGETLNDLAEFRGANPSAERLARGIGDRLVEEIDGDGLAELRVEVHEDDIASVTYEQAV